MSSNFLAALAGTRLYPVTDRYLSGLSHAEQVARLIDGGATLIQLREKVDPPSRFYTEAKAALVLARAHGVQLIINDRVDIALALHADGVHLGQDDLPPEAARRILGPDALIGYSTHNLEQAKLAAAMPIDYVAIGPIFPTATKQSENRSVGLRGLHLVRETLTCPLVAIGGITSGNIGSVLNAGADAAAIISDIWTLPSEITTKIRDLIDRSQSPTYR